MIRRFTIGVATAQLALLLCTGTASPQKNVTAEFFGSADRWNDAFLIFHEVSPLFGATEIYVSGRGIITIVMAIRHPNVGTLERRYVLKDALDISNELFGNMSSLDLLEIASKQEEIPNPPDTASPFFVLRNATGEVRTTSFRRNTPTGPHEDVMREMLRIASLVKNTKPAYEGDYDPTYVPDGFTWARETMRAAKDISWAPIASEEDIKRAEEEYRKREMMQKELIKKLKEEEAKRREQG